MDVLFINSTDSPQLRDQVNGTMLLATRLLQAGINTDILRFYQIDHFKKDYDAFVEDAVQKVLDRSPKCVSFYTLWPYFHVMLRIAQRIKACRPDIYTVMGGPQATFSAQQTMERMDFVDYVCTGEGEELVVPFFRAVLARDSCSLEQVPGVWHRLSGQVQETPGQTPLTDLEQLPAWDERLLPPGFPDNDPGLQDHNYFMPLDVGRGCPFRCTFCCTNQFLHRSYRLKSVDKIVAEMKYLKERYGIRSFMFSHDAFTTNKKLVEELCDRLIEEKLDIRWKCCSRIDLLTEELVLKMKKAGMWGIELGLETGSARMQKIINKKLDLTHARQMADFLVKQQLHVALFFMYGFPQETEEDLRQTLDLYFDLFDAGLSQASMAFCRFYPASLDAQAYMDELVLDPKIDKLTRNVFGYRQELEMFRQNKEMFPFYYNLPTPVREEFQYLFFLGHSYRRFPNFARYLRQVFPGDSLQFARVFIQSNREIFQKGMDLAERMAFDDPLPMFRNYLRAAGVSYEKQLLGLLQWEQDLNAVRRSKQDMMVERVYDFSYVEFKLKLPIEQYSASKTRILLEKKDGKVDMKVLKISKE